MSLDQRAKILKAVTSNSYGVKEIIHDIRGKRASNIISLLENMKQERLIDIKQVSLSKRGRPKKKVIATPLGYEFLKAYVKLQTKPLRSSQQDLERAKKDAHYVERLVANGHSPFQIFMELNAIVNNIKVSGTTSQAL